MQEIYFGFHMAMTDSGEPDPQRGCVFFGLEEVNALLSAGARVTSVEEAGVLMHKAGQHDGYVDMIWTGAQFKVVLQETPEFQPQKAQWKQ